MKLCSTINKCCYFILISFLSILISSPVYSQTGDSSDGNVDLCETNVCPEGQECIEDFFDFCPVKDKACVLCEYCGNGYKSETEACDDGNSNEEDECRECKAPACGDGISNDFDSSETCDDGNDIDTDSCRNDCTYCGDSIKDASEDCDDGNGDNIDGCRDDCTIQECGDSVVDSNETCDDGNDIGDDACRNNCTFCGDEVIDSTEECDGNNFGESGKPEEGAICNSSCVVEYCGDGIKQDYEICDPTDLSNIEEAAACTNECVQMECPGEGYELTCDFSCQDKDGNATFCCSCPECGDGETNGLEECDDGNDSNLDYCTNGCRNSVCGDDYKSPDEECDDGNSSNLDYCTNTCESSACGDGFKNGKEECDDGDDDDTNACKNDCTLSQVCGNGIKEAGEACDDGNTNNDDSCRNNCTSKPRSYYKCESIPFLPNCNTSPGRNARSCWDSRGKRTCSKFQLDLWCKRGSRGSKWTWYHEYWVDQRCSGKVTRSGNTFSCHNSSNNTTYQCTTPLVLVFDVGTPVEYVKDDGKSNFNLVSEDLPELVRTDWPTAVTPWLAYDRDGDGLITSGNELFGSGTDMGGFSATFGFEALAVFDKNKDEVIDEKDPDYGKLLLWSDINSDRISDKLELKTLSEGGVKSISLDFNASSKCDDRGNCEAERSSFTWVDEDGKKHEGEVIDINLISRTTDDE